jgi:sec-independent protein translocase protein TatA
MNEWVIVGIIAVAVIFGATKLPELARNVGRAQGEFKKGLKEGATAEGTEASPSTPPPAQAPTPPSSTAPQSSSSTPKPSAEQPPQQG